MHALATFALAAAAASDLVNVLKMGPECASALAFTLLVASLVAFMISTRQWPLLQRALIWLGGAGLLAGATTISIKFENGASVARVLAIAASDDHVRAGLLANLPTIQGYVSPSLNILFVLCAVVAVIALIAFTPGEAVERNLRRLGLVIGGVILGSALTLMLVAIGLGGNQRRALFIGLPETQGCLKDHNGECDVVDGDTIRFGDLSLRVSGIDAPEMDHCGKPENTMCGEKARQKVASLLVGKLVICYRPDDKNAESAYPSSAYGRPSVTCRVWDSNGRPFNLGAAIAGSYAKVCRYKNKPDGRYLHLLQCAASSRKPPPDAPDIETIQCSQESPEAPTDVECTRLLDWSERDGSQ